jgi:acyl-CoA synthetase (AMP-forming)/AMP-acid ligase II
MQYITDFLERNAQNSPHKVALVFEERSYTWHELEQAVQRVAGGLIRAQEQKVIAIFLPNSWEFIIAYLGILRAGHIAMPIDPTFKELEIKNVLDQIPAEQVITSKAQQHYFVDALDIQELEKAPTISGPGIHIGLDKEVASLLFTSGTTGKPKATAYTHSNYIWNVQAVSEDWRWNSDDTLLISLPLSHWHGLAMGIMGWLYHANTMYLQARFDAHATLSMLASGKISLFMHVPIAYLMMNEVAESYDISSVRLCVSGSSYLPPEVWHTFKKKYGHEILERYGASEMGLLTSNPLNDRQPGSVGYPLKDVQIRIEAHGEIAIKSPGLFPGYYQNIEATTKNITPDGFWLSGDIGELKNGRLTLKGRVQEKMKKFGYTIYPRDLEWALLKNEAVKDVFVLSVQNAGQDSMSDLIVYYVVTNLSQDEIQDYCKRNMPSFWRPDKIIKLDTIPKSPAGKPKLAILRGMITR